MFLLKALSTCKQALKLISKVNFDVAIQEFRKATETGRKTEVPKRYTGTYRKLRDAPEASQECPHKRTGKPVARFSSAQHQLFPHGACY